MILDIQQETVPNIWIMESKAYRDSGSGSRPENDPVDKRLGCKEGMALDFGWRLSTRIAKVLREDDAADRDHQIYRQHAYQRRTFLLC